MALIVHRWNREIFFWHGTQIALCEVFPETHTERSWFAFYCFSRAKILPSAEGNNYSPLSEGLRQLDIFDFLPTPLPTVLGDTLGDRHGARIISLRNPNISSQQGMSTDLDDDMSPVSSHPLNANTRIDAVDAPEGLNTSE